MRSVWINFDEDWLTYKIADCLISFKTSILWDHVIL